MNSEFQPASFEVEPQGGPSDSFELTELETLLCARTNLIATTNGDERSRLLLQHLIEVGEDGTAEIHCPVSICPVKYELTLENGGDTRRGDCAVIMAGISKQIEDAKSGKRPGMTFTEFAETPLGRKTIK